MKTGKNTERIADSLALLYQTAEYGPEAFLRVFEALTAKFTPEDREEIVRIFNEKIVGEVGSEPAA